MVDLFDVAIVRQHIGWLKIYVAQMNADNWRDMKDLCERQLTDLSSALGDQHE